MSNAAIRLALALSCATFTGTASAGPDDAFVEFRSLKPEYALQMAQAALESCREAGFQVGVTVVDRMGVPQVFLRDRFAGAHVYETSRRKAWTAVSFRSSTTDLDAATQPGAASFGIRALSEALPLGGGLLVQDGEGATVAGIGVSGAPSPSADDACAEAGIAAIANDIAF
ncbi:heme-binding protein [Sulfitobacter aestuarii]|uniref:Heme-binding protein n=1 Tax=Sulfitobacter aestuarii TaxID=2161676 RepID=A0ABW5U223_9RHOB